MRMSVCYFEDDSSISWDRRIMSFGQRMSLMGESYGYTLEEYALKISIFRVY